MYVIFPADEVVSLTYGRVIIPRTSSSRTPSTRRPSSGSSSRRCSTVDREINNTSSRNSPFYQNGTNGSDSPDISYIQRTKSFKDTRLSADLNQKPSNRSFLERVSVKRERSPKSDTRPPTLGPDPRLQLTNLQEVPQGSIAFSCVCENGYSASRLTQLCQ